MAIVRGSLHGAAALRRRLTMAPKAAVEAITRTEERIARDMIFPETQRQVPEDTGLLASTGAVERRGETVEITYGSGGAEDYALVQHERDDYYHPKPGAKSHFVSDPVADAARGMAGEIDTMVNSQTIFGTSS